MFDLIWFDLQAVSEQLDSRVLPVLLEREVDLVGREYLETPALQGSRVTLGSLV